MTLKIQQQPNNTTTQHTVSIIIHTLLAFSIGKITMARSDADLSDGDDLTSSFVSAAELSEAELGMKIIADSGGRTFFHLCLYNSLADTGSTADGIEGLMNIYSNHLTLHG